MKAIALFFGALFLAQMGTAQYGINAGAHFLHATEWENAIEGRSAGAESYATNFYLGVDYWFRLKNRRIEFFPELGYARTKADNRYDFEGNEWREENILQSASFFFNTHFYLLDFATDCNCPTFSKDGDVIKKGFFVRLAPGVQWLDYETKLLQEDTGDDMVGNFFVDDQFVFSLRGGIGIDIGLSDFLTLTPIVQANYTFDAAWPNLQEGPEQFSPDYDPTITSALSDSPLQWMAGLRIGLRFDELNKYGYR